MLMFFSVTFFFLRSISESSTSAIILLLDLSAFSLPASFLLLLLWLQQPNRQHKQDSACFGETYPRWVVGSFHVLATPHGLWPLVCWWRWRPLSASLSVYGFRDLLIGRYSYKERTPWREKYKSPAEVALKDCRSASDRLLSVTFLIDTVDHSIKLMTILF